MFYDTAKRDHGLPQDPLKAVIVPRPIGWISTVSRDGVWQKFYERDELISTVSEKGFDITRIAKVYYPWSVDGLRKPRGSKQLPWDWGFLAQRAA